MKKIKKNRQPRPAKREKNFKIMKRMKNLSISKRILKLKKIENSVPAQRDEID